MRAVHKFIASIEWTQLPGRQLGITWNELLLCFHIRGGATVLDQHSGMEGTYNKPTILKQPKGVKMACANIRRVCMFERDKVLFAPGDTMARRLKRVAIGGGNTGIRAVPTINEEEDKNITRGYCS